MKIFRLGYHICLVLKVYIRRKTPNATRSKAEFDRNKCSLQSLLTALCHKWPTHILKPVFVFYRLGFTEQCFDWSKRHFSLFHVFLTFEKGKGRQLSGKDATRKGTEVGKTN